MFVLRRISSDGVEMNHFLGRNYTFIHKGNVEDFKKVELDYKDCAGLMGAVYDDNGQSIPIMEHQPSYVMVDGRTVARLNN